MPGRSSDRVTLYLDLLQGIISKEFYENGGMEFMAVLIDSERGKFTQYLFPGMSKEEIGQVIREEIQEVQSPEEIDLVVIAAEAWALRSPDPDMSFEELKREARRYGGVAFYPWKQEVLALDFEDRDGHREGWHWEIERHGDRRTLGALMHVNGSSHMDESGHLQNFFT